MTEIITEYKKSTGVMVFNTAGELAMQLRAADDDSFPSHWDFAAGGGIDDGENEKAAAERELFEELGVRAEVVFLGQFAYQYAAWKPGIIRDADLWLYTAVHDGPFTPDPKEIQEVRFFSGQALALLVQRERMHPEFLCLWESGTVKHLLPV